MVFQLMSIFYFIIKLSIKLAGFFEKFILFFIMTLLSNHFDTGLFSSIVNGCLSVFPYSGFHFVTLLMSAFLVTLGFPGSGQLGFFGKDLLPKAILLYISIQNMNADIKKII